MRDFINFRKMITPVIIGTIFGVGFFFCVLAGVALIDNIGGWAIILIPLAILILRVICENFIVLFSINTTLLEINKTLLEIKKLNNKTIQTDTKAQETNENS